jgi:hypothetical protein
VELHFTADLERKLNDVAGRNGLRAEELVQQLVTDYLEAATGIREMLSRRYDDLKNGRVKPIDGETFFEALRTREEGTARHSRLEEDAAWQLSEEIKATWWERNGKRFNE